MAQYLSEDSNGRYSQKEIKIEYDRGDRTWVDDLITSLRFKWGESTVWQKQWNMWDKKK